MQMKISRVRVTTLGGRFLGFAPLGYANKLLQNKARYRVRRVGEDGRVRAISDMMAGTDRPPAGSTPLHYREQLSDTRSVITLRRIVQNFDYDGKFIGDTFEKWDQGLTFQEARDGVVVSWAARAANAARRASA